MVETTTRRLFFKCYNQSRFTISAALILGFLSGGVIQILSFLFTESTKQSSRICRNDIRRYREIIMNTFSNQQCRVYTVHYSLQSIVPEREVAVLPDCPDFIQLMCVSKCKETEDTETIRSPQISTQSPSFLLQQSQKQSRLQILCGSAV